MSLEDYISDISRVPLLTYDEEIILGSQIQAMLQVLRNNAIDERISQENLNESVQGLDPQTKKIVKKGLRARNRMISANMRLVVAVAKKMRTTQVHMTVQDMIQEGAIGLARATEKFEPKRGYKFSTYAYWWIRQGIIRAGENQERMIRVPSNVLKLARQARDAKAKLFVDMGREPTMPEIAEAVGEDLERVKRAMLADPIIFSFDHRAERENDLIPMIETIAAQVSSDEDDQHVLSRRAEFVMSIINALPPDEQLLIKQRHGIEMEALSFKELSEIAGVSQQLIRQRYQKIANKMRYVAGVFGGPSNLSGQGRAPEN